jgi:hypothetical protein
MVAADFVLFGRQMTGLTGGRVALAPSQVGSGEASICPDAAR